MLETLCLNDSVLLCAKVSEHQRYFFLFASRSCWTNLFTDSFFECSYFCLMFLNEKRCLVLLSLLKGFFELNHLKVVRLSHICQIFLKAGECVFSLLKFFNCCVKFCCHHFTNSVLKTNHQFCSLLCFCNFGGVCLSELFYHSLVILLHFLPNRSNLFSRNMFWELGLQCKQWSLMFFIIYALCSFVSLNHVLSLFPIWLFQLFSNNPPQLLLIAIKYLATLWGLCQVKLLSHLLFLITG